MLLPRIQIGRRAWKACPLRAARCPCGSSLTPFLAARPTPHPSLNQNRWSTHKSESVANGTKNGAGRRLGAKKAAEEFVNPGNVIFRQRGSQWHPGENCAMGRDHTIFATEPGYVRYYRDPIRHPKRRLIGVVFQRDSRLPTPLNEPRRRRLGMLAVPRKDLEPEGDDGALVLRAAPPRTRPGPSVKEVQLMKKTGRFPASQIRMSRDYSFREPNWLIGRTAERAGKFPLRLTRRQQERALAKKDAQRAETRARRLLQNPGLKLTRKKKSKRRRK